MLYSRHWRHYKQPEGVFWIYLWCMVVYISARVRHFAQLCAHQGECIFVLSVMFRCSTEMLFTVKHVVRVWLSHHVRETGSLCEHDPNVLLCNGEVSADLRSPFLWWFSLWCCLCGRSSSLGVSEAVKSSQISHVEFNQEVNPQWFVMRSLCGARQGRWRGKKLQTGLSF